MDRVKVHNDLEGCAGKRISSQSNFIAVLHAFRHPHACLEATLVHPWVMSLLHLMMSILQCVQEQVSGQ